MINEKEYDNNDEIYKDQMFNLDIEQLEITMDKFIKIGNKIKNTFQNKTYALTVIYFGMAYLRIYNLIAYLNNEFLSKEDVLDILSKIKFEIQYINNDIYAYYKKCFLSFVDEKSNLHKIDKLDEGIDDLYLLVNKQKVDK